MAFVPRTSQLPVSSIGQVACGVGAVTVTIWVKVEVETLVETAVVEAAVVEVEGFGGGQPELHCLLSDWSVIGTQPGSPLSGCE